MFDKAQLPPDKWEERLALEYSLVLRHEPTFGVVEGDIQKYRGVIIGTGSYEGGFFRVEVLVARNYPYTPPKVRWLTKIWHPNITDNVPASVCESVLSRDWTPALNIFSIIESLRALLAYPNPEDPLNGKAAEQLKRRPNEFMEKVREFVRRYAGPEQAFGVE